MRDSYTAPEELATLRTAFELVPQGVFVVDAREQRIVDANPAACVMLEIARRELIGRSWSDTCGLLPPAMLHDAGGGRFVAIVPDGLTERAVCRVVLRDALTGLANRDALLERISRDRGGEPLAKLGLLFVDLDNFKQVNDAWGHLAGDRVLRIVAQRLNDSVRPGDLVVRYGGDEFLVVVEGVRRGRDLQRLARRIARGVEVPILVEGHELVLSASIGVARRNSRIANIDALIAEADRDMYRGKSLNRIARRALSATQVLRTDAI